MIEEVKESIYKNLNLNKYSEFVPKWGSKPPILIGQLVDALFDLETGPKAIASLGRSEQSFNRNIKKLFLGVTLQGGGQSWKQWLISQSDYKKCSKCESFKLKIEYNKSSDTYDMLSYLCRDCAKVKSAKHYSENKSYFQEYWKQHLPEQRAKNAKRRALLLQRTVKWANLVEIEQFYINCPKGYHVDHYYPLQGKTVCGLHVLENLQYLPAAENLSKGNRMPEELGDMAKLVETRQT